MKNAGEIGGLTSPFVTLNTYKHVTISNCLSLPRQQEIWNKAFINRSQNTELIMKAVILIELSLYTGQSS